MRRECSGSRYSVAVAMELRRLRRRAPRAAMEPGHLVFSFSSSSTFELSKKGAKKKK